MLTEQQQAKLEGIFKSYELSSAERQYHMRYQTPYSKKVWREEKAKLPKPWMVALWIAKVSMVVTANMGNYILAAILYHYLFGDVVLPAL